MAALRSLFLALWAHVRKLLACMRAPGQLLRLVLSLIKSLSRWMKSHTNRSRSLLPPTLKVARGESDNTHGESWPSGTIMCASRVPETLTPGMAFGTDPTDLNSGASIISLASTQDRAHDESMADPLSYNHTQSRTTLQNVSATNPASLHYIPRSISTPNLPGSRPSTRTGVCQAGARWTSARSRSTSCVSGRRPSPASNRSATALTMVCHYVSPNDSIFLTNRQPGHALGSRDNTYVPPYVQNHPGSPRFICAQSNGNPSYSDGEVLLATTAVQNRL
jgi:hypothetical protein